MKRIFAFIGFTMAITLILLNILSYSFSLLILSIAVVLFFASLLPKSIRQAGVLPVVFGSIVFACLLFVTSYNSAVVPAKALDGVTANVKLQIIDLPDYNVQKDYYTYDAIVCETDIPNTIVDYKIKLKSKELVEAECYDYIYANISFYNTTDDAFESYGLYADKIFICARLNDVDEIINNENRPLRYYHISFRQMIYDNMNYNLRGDKAGLSIALLTGNKSYLSNEMQSQFKNSGLSHFLAVSGFHISIICLSVYYALKKLRVPKIINTVISLIILFFYCSVASFSMSSVRAGIMVAVLIISRLFNTKADSLNSLGFAVAIMCLNPFAVTDAGAVLTVSAVLGINCIYKPISSLAEYKNKVSEYLDNSVLFSICVLLAVTPALYVFFGNISLGSVFFNIIIEPIIVLLLVLTILFNAFVKLSALCFIPKALIGLLTGLLKTILTFITNNFSSLIFNIDNMMFGVAIGSIFIFMGIMLLSIKKINVKATVIYLILVFALSSAFGIYQANSYSNVFVSSSSMVVIYDRNNAIVIDMDSSYDMEDAKPLIKNKDVIYIDSKMSKENITLTDNVYSLSNRMSLCTDDDTLYINVGDKHFEITDDCVIINETCYYRNGYKTDYTSYYLTFADNTEIKVRRD